MLLGSHGLSPRRNFNYLGNYAAEADNKFWPALLELFRPREQQELVIGLSQKSAYNRMAFLR